MESLSGARAELAHLEHRELQLLQELSDVRKALAAQKVVLDELVKASAIPYIDCLPNELLAQIFLLIRYEQTSLATLAGVSRRWRSVLISSPSIWSEIDLDAEYKCPVLLESYLERSRQAPLTIIGRALSESDAIFLHANRWHTLRILDSASQTLDRISRITLPSLRHLYVYGRELSLDNMLIIRSCVPALKRLELVGWDPPLHKPLSQIIPAESLEELTLTSNNRDWKFQQDSMHFPLLRRLTLAIRDPIPFLEAIVAPKLVSFSFAQGYRQGPFSKTYDGSRMKFDNVSHLSLSSVYMTDGDTSALCRLLCHIFCGIRHASIHVDHVSTLFISYGQGTIDHWRYLESLDIQNFTLGSPDPFHYLIEWVMLRRSSDQRKLHLKLTRGFVTDDLLMLNTSDTLFRKLQECYASVVLDRIPVSPQVSPPTSAGSLLSNSPTCSAVNV